MDAPVRTTSPSALVVDAKSLYDSVKKETPVQSAACKRTAVELIVLRQTLKVTASVLRWVSSERQLADGLTKNSARQLFADRLKSQQYRLVYDSTFTAAKRKTAAVRRASELEHATSSYLIVQNTTYSTVPQTLLPEHVFFVTNGSTAQPFEFDVQLERCFCANLEETTGVMDPVDLEEEADVAPTGAAANNRQALPMEGPEAPREPDHHDAPDDGEREREDRREAVEYQEWDWWEQEDDDQYGYQKGKGKWRHRAGRRGGKGRRRYDDAEDEGVQITPIGEWPREWQLQTRRPSQPSFPPNAVQLFSATMSYMQQATQELSQTTKLVLEELRETRLDRNRERTEFMAALRDAPWRRDRRGRDSRSRSRGRRHSRDRDRDRRSSRGNPEKRVETPPRGLKQAPTKQTQAPAKSGRVPKEKKMPKLAGLPPSGSREVPKQPTESSHSSDEDEVDWEWYNQKFLLDRTPSPDRHYPPR